MVFPNGYSAFPSGILATWNAGACCGGAVEQNSDDSGFIRAVVEDVSRKLNINRKRLYSTGMSNGGLMSYRLACELSGVFAAIAPVAGTDNTYSCNPVKPVAVVHFHAMNDDHVPFYGGKGSGSKVDVEFKSVPDTIKKWVAQNSCSPMPKRTLTVDGAYCDTYLYCQDGAQVKLCVTSTGGHSWPGAPHGRSSPPSQAISANDIMWEFFNRPLASP